MSSRRPFYKKLWFWLIVIAAAIIAAVLITMNLTGSKAPSKTATTTTDPYESTTYGAFEFSVDTSWKMEDKDGSKYYYIDDENYIIISSEENDAAINTEKSLYSFLDKFDTENGYTDVSKNLSVDRDIDGAIATGGYNDAHQFKCFVCAIDGTYFSIEFVAENSNKDSDKEFNRILNSLKLSKYPLIAPAAEIPEEEEPQEEPSSYRSDITYSNLLSKSEEYIAEYVEYSGEVVRVLEGTASNSATIAVDGDYSKMIGIDYSSYIANTALSEGDYITVYGAYTGIKQYATMGEEIAFPWISVNEIELR